MAICYRLVIFAFAVLRSSIQAGSVDAAMLSIPSTFTVNENGYRELVSFIDQEWVELQGSVVSTEQVLATEPGLVE